MRGLESKGVLNELEKHSVNVYNEWYSRCGEKFLKSLPGKDLLDYNSMVDLYGGVDRKYAKEGALLDMYMKKHPDIWCADYTIPTQPRDVYRKTKEQSEKPVQHQRSDASTSKTTGQKMEKKKEEE